MPKQMAKLLAAAALVFCVASQMHAQTITILRDVNLRPTASSAQPAIVLLTPKDSLTLLANAPTSGYYHVRTPAGQEGWVWRVNVQVDTLAVTAASLNVHPGPGVPGSASVTGCGDGLWKHVYKPDRLIVKQNCMTVTGVIVDATANQSTHRADGVRHEADGDTHGWLKVDAPFASLLNAGNQSDEGGNLVFEMVCHFKVTQVDAKPACDAFADKVKLPPVGTHVSITGTYVQDTNHSKWNEIHPVSKIVVK